MAVVDTVGRLNKGGGAQPGAGKPLDVSIQKFRDHWRKHFNTRAGRERLEYEARREPMVRVTLLRLSYPVPIEPQAGPPAMPPFVLMIGQNGGGVALGYAPQGVVPGMEAFMPREVKALPAPQGNGRKNGRGLR